MLDPELLERITARRAELDELEEQLAKQLAEVRDERDELAVAERVRVRARPSLNPTRMSPGHIAAAFDDLERHGRVHAPTTSLLVAFHEALGARFDDRAALLIEQLRSPDPGTRYDAIDMARCLITSWRGDHTHLVQLIGDCLQPHDSYTSAAAAEALGKLGALAAWAASSRWPRPPGRRKPPSRRSSRRPSCPGAGLGGEGDLLKDVLVAVVPQKLRAGRTETLTRM